MVSRGQTYRHYRNGRDYVVLEVGELAPHGVSSAEYFAGEAVLLYAAALEADGSPCVVYRCPADDCVCVRRLVAHDAPPPSVLAIAPTPVAVYRDAERPGGQVWVRPCAEFEEYVTSGLVSRVRRFAPQS